MTADRDEPSKTLRRRLGSFERAQALSAERFPHNLVICLTLKDADLSEPLRSALDEVQRRHPLLRSRLLGKGSDLCFAIQETPAIELTRGVRIDDRVWRQVVEDELVRGFETGLGPLARVTYLAPAENSSASELILTFHHLIADATGVTELLGELLRICNGAATGSRQVSDGFLPPAPDDGFPKPFRPRASESSGSGLPGISDLRRLPATTRFLSRQLLQEIACRKGLDRRPRPAQAPVRDRALSLEIPAEESRAILSAARRHRVTPTGLFEAVALLTVVRHRYHGPKLPHAFFVFPLLRPYLDPPVPDHTLAGYLCAMRLTETVAATDDLWELAARISQSIRRAAKRGDKYLSSIWSPFSINRAFAANRRMATTAVSYTGPFELRAEGVELLGLGAFVTNPPIGPEFTAQVRLLDGRLRWDAVTLASDMDETAAHVILEDIRRLLVEAALHPQSR